MPRDPWLSRVAIFVVAALFSFLVALAVLKLHQCRETGSSPSGTTPASMTTASPAPTPAEAASAALPAPSAPPGSTTPSPAAANPASPYSPEIFVLQHPYDPIFGQGIPIVMTVRAKRMTPFQIRFILMIGSEPSDWNALLLPQVISNPESNWVKSNGVVYLKLSYTNK